MKLILAFVMFLYSASLIAQNRISLEVQTKITALEKATQTRLEKLLEIALDRNDLFVDVDLKVVERKEKGNTKNQRLEYLPLLANGSVPQQLQGHKISGFTLTVLSKQGFSLAEKKKVNEVIQGIFNNEAVEVKFSKLIEGSAEGVFSRFWKHFTDFRLAYWLLYGFVLIGLYYGIVRFRMHLKRLQSKVSNVHQYNLSELIKFIKSHLDKNRNILKFILKDERSDIMGFKSLIPFVDVYFQIPELVSSPYLYSVAEEKNFYTEDEFYFWMKDLSERITHYYLKEIPQISSIKEESHKIWPVEDLSLVPSLYLIRKLRTRSQDELVKIIEGLSDGQKYFMIKHIDELFSAYVLERIELGKKESNAENEELTRFLREVQADFDRGEFSIEDIQKAS